MSELNDMQELNVDNDISLAWDEYEKCGEVGNYAENLLHAAEFYQTESKIKEQENKRLTAIASQKATRCDELYEALEKLLDINAMPSEHKKAREDASKLLARVKGDSDG